MYGIYLDYDNTLVGDYWAGKCKCPCCENHSDFHLERNFKHLSILFIPVLTAVNDRYLCCDSCGYFKKLRIKDYIKIKAQQKNRLEEKEYPREMIEQDFSPGEVKIIWKIIKLVLTGAIHLLFFLLLAFDGIVAESILTRVTVAFLLSLVFAVPFLFSLKAIIPCWRKRWYYKKRAEFPSLAELAMGDEVNDISDLVGTADVEAYEHMLRGMDTEKNEPCVDIHRVADAADEADLELPKPLKAAPSKYPKGKGWFSYGSLLFVVPKSFLGEKDLHAPCYRLAAGRFKMLLIWQSILMVVALTFVSGGIKRLIANVEGVEGMFFLGALCIGGSVGILFANRAQISRIIKSLRMLVKTGKFQNMDEIMPFIGNTNEKFIFTKELMYDKGSRLVVAYDDILWLYNTVDENGNVSTSFHMSDGLRYTSTMNEGLMRIFLKKKPDILVGKTPENENLYKQKLALLNKCGQ